MKLFNRDTGEFVVENLDVRSTIIDRTIGYLGQRKPLAGSGILLLNTRQVHTLGMLFTIDIFFLDGSMRILGIRRCVKPFRLPGSLPGTKHILEVPHQKNFQNFIGSKNDQLSIIVRLPT